MRTQFIAASLATTLATLPAFADPTAPVVALTSGSSLHGAGTVISLGQPTIGLAVSSPPGMSAHLGFVPPSTTPACQADFNGTGGLTVQDIFDFLGAYFAMDPRADFNGVGGLTVQDIFDFLGVFFTGCP